MSAEFLPMILELDCQRHRREIAEGFAKLREEYAPPPPREKSPQQLLMEALNQMSAEQQMRHAYRPHNPMNCHPLQQSYLWQDACPRFGDALGLRGIFGAVY